jgi:diguanylate cyclase (GGDEF)-like protein
LNELELEARISGLAKENRILKKQLARSEENRVLLEESLFSHLELLKLRNAELVQFQEKIRLSEAKYKELAHYDSLTGLPNRILFQDQLARTIFRAKREQCSVALLFIDLDRFKDVNDLAGHDAGDSVLKETGRRLLACIRGGDMASRIGGDEFVIVLDSLPERQVAMQVAERILAAMSRPFVFQEDTFSIGASIGVSLFPFDGEDTETLLQKADCAMYGVKRSGRNGWKFFHHQENKPHSLKRREVKSKSTT